MNALSYYRKRQKSEHSDRLISVKTFIVRFSSIKVRESWLPLIVDLYTIFSLYDRSWWYNFTTARGTRICRCIRVYAPRKIVCHSMSSVNNINHIVKFANMWSRKNRTLQLYEIYIWITFPNYMPIKLTCTCVYFHIANVFEKFM